MAVATTAMLVKLGVLLSLLSSATALWPIPRQLSTGNSTVRLASNFGIHANFAGVPSDVNDAISRTLSLIKTDQLAPLVIDRGASLVPTIQRAKELESLTLELSSSSGSNPKTTVTKAIPSISEEAVKAIGERDESYTLSLPGDGSTATIKANTTLGLLRGMTTFTQLLFTVDNMIFTSEAPVEITDSPAFPFRGFMLDTARNFFPVSDIKRTLDAMSWSKINQFHWHVTDSQSFPLQIPGFMELSQKAAYTASSVYTPSDVSDIVSYAAERGIDVLVEIDTPGHTAAISKSHPEHIACNEATPWANFANEPPAGQLRLASDATTNFTASLLSAVAKMFPSTIMSTGGDELNVNCYTQDEQTQQELNSTGLSLEQALSKFTVTTHAAIEKLGKTPVVWEEMVLAHNVTLSNNTIAMVWISSDDVAAVAAKGFRIVHGPSDFFYLDCGAGEWVGVDIGNSWCDPFKTWQKAYSFDPFANLSESQQSLILGGEQLLWTEQSSPSNLDPIAWPRAATSAEVFWTGATLPDGTPRNSNTGSDTALPRLHDLQFRMVARGVNAIPLQPQWCAVRPGVCDLTA